RRLREREAKRQQGRLDRLTAEQDKLMKALYADAVPFELFKQEQNRIAREKIEAEQLLKGSMAQFDAVERAIERGIDVVGNLYEMYKQASPRVRRLLNQS